MTQPLSRRHLMLTAGAFAAAGCTSGSADASVAQYASSPFRRLTEAQWRERLPAASFNVLRREATERPFTSPLDGEKRTGVFHCRGCDLPLFQSAWKFDSRTGWPSFYRAIDGSVGTKTDLLIGFPRTEYHCARCLGHQGHIFDDGPRPTGKRYCNNGVALTFKAA
ncbi:peptide-methionine (R)-S-oxide reductase MsrB [Brevundimonas variabilis]|uniref:peptide-methionine (R)-S-oxide reductase n=1 Tax=Brevundimonas variabilis TaxID=74312 RepID=A0A7W9CHU8_9CAUL|nr:peptide-methionine (R)-S-oxide reductase MsrB [Brevundimonas variabilis]MBB5745883.1 peptide-methionine (R)-S-oxide reductase [Brevundimonas variabilis]